MNSLFKSFTTSFTDTKNETNEIIERLRNENAEREIQLGILREKNKELNKKLTEIHTEKNIFEALKQEQIQTICNKQIEEQDQICKQQIYKKVKELKTQHAGEINTLKNEIDFLKTENKNTIEGWNGDKVTLLNQRKIIHKQQDKEIENQECLKNKQVFIYISIFACLLLTVGFVFNMCFISVRSTIVNENNDVTEEVYSIYDQINSFLSILCVVSLILKVILISFVYRNPCDDSKIKIITFLLGFLHLTSIGLAIYLFVRSQKVMNDEVRKNIASYATIHIVINIILLFTIIFDGLQYGKFLRSN